MTNAEIIRHLRRLAAETAQNHGNLYRARAYRQAGFRLSALHQPIASLTEDDLHNLGIGKKLSRKILAWAAATSANTPVR